jgi:hypothetical protein
MMLNLTDPKQKMVKAGLNEARRRVQDGEPGAKRDLKEFFPWRFLETVFC